MVNWISISGTLVISTWKLVPSWFWDQSTLTLIAKGQINTKYKMLALLTQWEMAFRTSRDTDVHGLQVGLMAWDMLVWKGTCRTHSCKTPAEKLPAHTQLSEAAQSRSLSIVSPLARRKHLWIIWMEPYTGDRLNWCHLCLISGNDVTMH